MKRGSGFLAFVFLAIMPWFAVAEPFEDLSARAWRGHAQSQFDLGLMYADGRNVPQDDALALTWYRKAANQGYAPAQTNLGVMYANGQNVSKSDAEAVTWYRKAANQGYAPAQSNLGLMYERGRGVPVNAAEAARWYRMAAAQGYVPAQLSLDALPPVAAPSTQRADNSGARGETDAAQMDGRERAVAMMRDRSAARARRLNETPEERAQRTATEKLAKEEKARQEQTRVRAEEEQNDRQFAEVEQRHGFLTQGKVPWRDYKNGAHLENLFRGRFNQIGVDKSPLQNGEIPTRERATILYNARDLFLNYVWAYDEKCRSHLPKNAKIVRFDVETSRNGFTVGTERGEEVAVAPELVAAYDRYYRNRSMGLGNLMDFFNGIQPDGNFNLARAASRLKSWQDDMGKFVSTEGCTGKSSRQFFDNLARFENDKPSLQAEAVAALPPAAVP